MPDSRSKPLFSIANPCQQTIEDSGFCQHCQKTVHDLSKLTRLQALELYYGNQQQLCTRLVFDPNGQVQFLPEPPSVCGKIARASLVGTAVFTAQAVAQPASRCAIEVHIADGSGAAVPQAKVTLLPKQTGNGDAMIEGTADDLGVLRQAVASGVYNVRIVVSGFAMWSREVACDEKQQPIKLNAVLSVGSVGQGVIVDSVPSPFRRLQFALRRLLRRA